jgi:hypothetical protein
LFFVHLFLQSIANAEAGDTEARIDWDKYLGVTRRRSKPESAAEIMKGHV